MKLIIRWEKRISILSDQNGNTYWKWLDTNRTIYPTTRRNLAYPVEANHVQREHSFSVRN